MKKKIICILSYILIASNFTSAYATIKTHSELLNFEIGSSFLYENANWGYSDGLLNIAKNTGSGYKYGYVDTLGNTIIPFVYDEAEPFSDGYAVVCQYVNGSPKYGFIDKTGKQIVPFIYDYAKGFSEGFAAVGNYSENHYIKSGFINTAGSVVIPLNYINTDFFSNGLARVSVDSNNDGFPEFGYIDTSGNTVIPLEYSNANHFTDEGFASVARSINDEGTVKWAFINKSGGNLTQFVYDFAGSFSDNYATFGVYSTVMDYYKPTYGYINTEGRETIFASFDGANSFTGNLAPVYNGSNYGYINNLGTVVISYAYNDALPFSDGVAAVCVNGKWGYIDTAGQTVTPFIYDKASNFCEGFATVVYNGATQVISNPLNTIDYSEILVPATNSSIFVNGELLAFEGYTINGNNYFKLRDIAAVSNGTVKQFEVSWNGSTNSIDLTSFKPYTVVGGELGAFDMTSKMAKPNSSTIYINGVRVSLTAYTINSNNYFKLRDICKAFDIGVTWNGATNSIGIDHNIPYTD